ncbi:hypothetical protein COUCH_33300 [Couchioplanes caeruleus]|uniref:hypothetical protein n=1 Tax=Couchioplanes caeruleus TaxID=56438 RepID=UPI0020C0679A|nr:hypothetical protein [Couchioplanes caeruleus]UQU63813.1 hypothetical protein COUCH_33300 [Couchioplanes caeruleus]
MIMRGAAGDRGWLRLVILAAAAGVIAVLAVVVARPHAGSPAPAEASDGGSASGQAAEPVSFGFACDATAGDHCARLLADFGRRAELSAAQRSAAEPVADKATQVFVDSAAAGAESARRALSDAGFDAVARVARTDDLAAAGSVLAAVATGPACVVLLQDTAGIRGYIAGRLPDDGCLAA